MSRRRFQPRLRLEIADGNDTEPAEQIAKYVVVLDHEQSLELLCLRLPFRDRFLPALGKLLVALLVALRMCRIDLRQPLGERLRHDGDVARIGLDMRIALRMDVTLAAIDAGRHLEEAYEARRFEVSRPARLNPVVARFAHEQRQPADLELGAGAHDEVGAP